MAVSRGGSEGFPLLEASNGVFVNGVEIGNGTAVELTEGDRVSLVCGNENGSCGILNRIGFVVERIVLEGCDVDGGVEIDGLTSSGHSQSGKRSKRVFAVKANVSRCERVVGRARFLLDRCRDILLSDDPLSYIRHAVSDLQCGFKCGRSTELPQRVMENTGIANVQSSSALLCDSKVIDLEPESDPFGQKGNLEVASTYKNPNSIPLDSIGKDDLPSHVNRQEEKHGSIFYPSPGTVRSSSALLCESKVMDLEAESDPFRREGNLGVACVNGIADKNPNSVLSDSIWKDDFPFDGNRQGKKHGGIFYPPPGKNFYLNRLEYMNHGSSGLHQSISLPELIHPIESVSRMFIATFTSDIKWCVVT